MAKAHDAQDLAVARTSKIPSTTRLIASAMAAERRSLERLASFQRATSDVSRNRVAPILARIADDLSVGGSCVASWRAAARASAAESERLKQTVVELGAAFAAAGLRWVLLSGADLSFRVYASPADREVRRVEVLVDTAELENARRVCSSAGWRGSDTGAGRDRALREEGCSWRARNGDGLELDLYFRLWQWVPEYMQREVLERAQPAAELGATANRPSLVDAYLIAAQRVWIQQERLSLIHWCDLQRIVEAGRRSVGREVYREARRAGLHLPVGFSGAVAAGLWGHDCNRQVADLLRELQGWEKAVLRFYRVIGPEKMPAVPMIVARMLTGRRTRIGWPALMRPVWAHPGVVEDETAEKWPAPVRRTQHLLLSIGRCLRPRSGDRKPSGV